MMRTKPGGSIKMNAIYKSNDRLSRASRMTIYEDYVSTMYELFFSEEKIDEHDDAGNDHCENTNGSAVRRIIKARCGGVFR